MNHRGAWVAVLCLGLIMSFAVTARSASAWKALISARFPKVEWMDSETLSASMDGPGGEQLVIVDVRTPEEQRVSQLRGAQFLDPSKPELDTLDIPEDATVVVYCSIGYRSASVVSMLEEAGFKDVYNLEGGLFHWANQNRPLFRDEERVHDVHPFNAVWGLLLRPELRSTD